jgi:hypothetical protein
MRGERLVVANKIATKMFKHSEGFSPRNGNRPSKYGRTVSDNYLKRMIGIFRKTKVVCSCYMCGNPRRYWNKITINEAKQHYNADIQYDEIKWRHNKSRWMKHFGY